MSNHKEFVRQICRDLGGVYKEDEFGAECKLSIPINLLAVRVSALEGGEAEVRLDDRVYTLRSEKPHESYRVLVLDRHADILAKSLDDYADKIEVRYRRTRELTKIRVDYSAGYDISFEIE